MKRFVSLIFVALLFFGCSNSKDLGAADTSDQSSKFYGAKVAINVKSLPICDSTKLGQLFYTIAEEQFHFCSELGYSVIDLQGKMAQMARLESMETKVLMGRAARSRVLRQSK